MIGEIFSSIINNLKSTAPISIVLDAAFGVILLIAGIILLTKQARTKKQKTGGWVCVSISALAFVGAVSNWLVAYKIF